MLRETPLPADWKPSEAHVAFAGEHGLDLSLEATGFRGHYDGQRCASWNGRFTTWLANQAKWNKERGPRKAKGPLQPNRADDNFDMGSRFA